LPKNPDELKSAPNSLATTKKKTMKNHLKEAENLPFFRQDQDGGA